MPPPKKQSPFVERMKEQRAQEKSDAKGKVAKAHKRGRDHELERDEVEEARGNQAKGRKEKVLKPRSSKVAFGDQHQHQHQLSTPRTPPKRQSPNAVIGFSGKCIYNPEGQVARK
jgi:hypothetical protein